MANTSDYEDDDIIAHYENQGSGNEQDGFGETEEATSDKEAEAGAARKVDPSTSRTHVVRNPIPKLNTERLKGPNGILMIEKYFDNFKFYGKGHEKTDLDRIMKRLEHWSHRLFPKYHFDDFLTRVEQLGAKKDMQVFMKKYRLDTIESNDDALVAHDNADNEELLEDAPLDDFDLLISEQIQKQKQVKMQDSTSAAAVPNTSNEDAFDELLRQSDNLPNSQIQITDNIKSELNDEIKAKIERNKQLAIQRRLQRHKEEEEAEKKRLVENTDMESPSIVGSNPAAVDEMNTSQADGIRIKENTSEE